MEFSDIHCHIMPYVDDGATDLDEAMELLEAQQRQSVNVLCLTPHCREEMFSTSDEQIRRGFDRLRRELQRREMPIELHLGREYYYDSAFLDLLEQGNVIPLGESNVLLVEFDSNASENRMRQAVDAVMSCGYRILIAHIERYHIVQEDPTAAQRLRERGGLIQVNAGSILGDEGWRTKKTAMYLLKKQAVFAVASDAHGMEFRPPKLKKCADYLRWRISRDYAERIFRTNPLSILQMTMKEQNHAESYVD